MLKKIITALGLTLFTTISYADYFYSYKNLIPLTETRSDPYDLFDDYVYGSLTFITNMQLAPSTTYNIGTRYSGTFETIFTRYVGFNLNGTQFTSTYSGGFVTTDENSQIIEWAISGSISEPWAYSTTNTSSFSGDAAGYFGGNDSMVWQNSGGGTWTVTVQAIPEPSTLVFLLTGFITLGLLRRYKTEV